MKKFISIIFAGAIILGTTSCNDFLKEDPKTFLTPENYYTNESQMHSATNGLYDGLWWLIKRTSLSSASSLNVFLEYLAGNVERTANQENSMTAALRLIMDSNLNIFETVWDNMYINIENCNSVIEGIEKSTSDVPVITKNSLLGEAYFLRAYYYYNLVRLYGPIPLKIERTTGANDSKILLSREKTIFDQIVSDLETAELLKNEEDWNNANGRVSKGAVKALLAEVYLTMAGYPVKDESYYSKAYDKACEVVSSNAFSLYPDYSIARDGLNINGGEYLLSIQCTPNYAESELHSMMLPYPEPEHPIAANGFYGGGMVPCIPFFNSFAVDDLRIAEQGYHFTHYPALDGSGEQTFSRPCVFKYWDPSAVNSGQSGANYPLIRYTNVLLTLAEAACAGGNTSDETAINAYYEVRKRALPNEEKPVSISFEMVYKERVWEECYEARSWFDIIRTRKAFNVITGKVVDAIGYKAPAHGERAFEEKDFLLDYPISEVRLNEHLDRTNPDNFIN